MKSGPFETAREVKAVIFDVYHTLLAVSPGPEPREAEERWREAWRLLDRVPEGSLDGFNTACRAVVADDHAVRKAAGAGWPEVDWRAVACRAAPALVGLDDAVLDDFLWAHARLQRTTSAMPGAAAFLADLRKRGVLAGIASNAQQYTFAELKAAGLAPDQFQEDLRFWSFQQGFSKPDPAVFRWLTERLAALGILPEETLIIGDRLDNDIEPAHAAGWQAWHFLGAWPDSGAGFRG